MLNYKKIVKKVCFYEKMWYKYNIRNKQGESKMEDKLKRVEMEIKRMLGMGKWRYYLLSEENMKVVNIEVVRRLLNEDDPNSKLYEVLLRTTHQGGMVREVGIMYSEIRGKYLISPSHHYLVKKSRYSRNKSAYNSAMRAFKCLELVLDNYNGFEYK